MVNTMNTPTLDLTADPIDLTAALVDIASPSFSEKEIADALEKALRLHCGDTDTVEILRYRNNVMARTYFDLGSRVIVAGHIDTVPLADNVPSRRITDAQGNAAIFGCGSVDMKSGDAVFAHLFATLAGRPPAETGLCHDLTVVFYEAEEVAATHNGLGHIQREHPSWLEGDVAILGEPSGAVIEAGCQGSIRLKVTARGERAHSARAWLGKNAMHLLGPVIARIAEYQPREVDIDGCHYHEGLNVVMAECGVANNTIPDEAWMNVNFRFAPDRTEAQALEHMLDVLQLPEGVDYEVDDSCSGALPGLKQPAAAALVRATGKKPRAKFGWTDVARFAQLGIPAVNFGPGDPAYCHKKDEHCPEWMITEVARTVREFLCSPVD